MRILVYGAGVQGSLYAARLTESGHDVALLARGDRLVELRARGIMLEDILTGLTTTTFVPIVECLESGDAFDLVLIPVRREQVESVLPVLAAAKNVPVLCFMHNHAGGSTSLAKAVGVDRVLLGFPGAGGARSSGGVVRYGLIAQQPTTIGELDGRITLRLRLRRVADAFRAAGFRTAMSRHMDAWLTAHAVFVTALSGALYRQGGDPAKVAARWLCLCGQCVKGSVRSGRADFRTHRLTFARSLSGCRCGSASPIGVATLLGRLPTTSSVAMHGRRQAKCAL
jgi:2-dehydropantoate 2-reductase